MTIKSNLDGFDPLISELNGEGPSMAQVLEEASRRIIVNILKSYTGYYDIFSEILQNSLDALQARTRYANSSYKPRLWILIDVPASRVRIVDNGVGMDENEFRFCLRPNVSFKKQSDLRGHKGVGATFLAYGFSFIKIQSKKSDVGIAAILRQGRQWAEDTSGSVPRPRFEAIEFDCPELAGESSGTAIEVILGGSPGERPRHLGWTGAQTAEQWMNILRIKTPLGGVYLSTPPTDRFRPSVEITVISTERTHTTATTTNAEYFYPHEIPNLKTSSLGDIQNALGAISGDSNTKFTRLPPEFKRLDCLYEIWDKDALLSERSAFESALDEEQKQLIERHNVIVYASFLRSAKLWGELNDEILRLRKGQRIIHGGLQMASDFMAQGELSIIPLTSTIGYQANSHVLVHFTDGNPDLGRKTFQPELQDLANVLSVRAVNTMKRFMQHMKPDTGAQTITPDRELHEWKRAQESYRERSALAFSTSRGSVSLLSKPQQEQDVIALFHELVGMGLMRGYRFFATSQSDRYDALFLMEYRADADVLFDARKNRLGITRDYKLPYTTEPKVLEYKYSFDSLVSDFDKEEKYAKHIDLVVCWSVGTQYREKYDLQSLLVADEGATRQMYGATHQAFTAGTAHPDFEVIVLEDLLGWLQDPADEEARQKRLYRDQ